MGFGDASNSPLGAKRIRGDNFNDFSNNTKFRMDKSID